jgi:NAD-dependent dihydropyrimidine dehydrogenase PreA subunit
MTYVICQTLHRGEGHRLRRCLPVDCIHPKKNTSYDDGRPSFDEVSQLYIDPTECIDSGACVPVCPVSAIFALDDLPEKWKQSRRSTQATSKAANSRPQSSPNTG